jgi:hypothetical protein
MVGGLSCRWKGGTVTSIFWSLSVLPLVSELSLFVIVPCTESVEQFAISISMVGEKFAADLPILFDILAHWENPEKNLCPCLFVLMFLP